MGHRRDVAANRSLPNHPMIVTPAAHVSPREVPQYGSQGAQPVHAQDHIVAIQRNDEGVDDELLSVDEDTCRAADTSGGHPVTVGDLDTEARVRQDVQVQTTRSHDGDEGVCGARVDQGSEWFIGHTDGQLHGVVDGEARDGV
jgi:hypothetical protein